MTQDNIFTFVASLIALKVLVAVAEGVLWLIETARKLPKLEPPAPAPGPPLLRMLSLPQRVLLVALGAALVGFLVLQWMPLAWVATGSLALFLVAGVLGPVPQLGRRVMRLFST